MKGLFGKYDCKIFWLWRHLHAYGVTGDASCLSERSSLPL
jgi:hypothetical protein